MAAADSHDGRRLTARGAKTKSRIVAAAAKLMYVQGVSATTLDDVIAASGTSKSQLYHHFDGKDALVRDVVELVGRQVMEREEGALGHVSTIGGLHRWRDALIQNNALQHGAYGCALGSLANDVADHDAVARQMLGQLFSAWQHLLAEALRRLQSNGSIAPGADADQLATGLMAALQGGYLLAQAARDIGPMSAALDMALAHIESFTVQ
jgi:TetR/AcrR family transcriptional repressor of nem operon